MTAIQKLLPRTKTSILRGQIKRQSELLEGDFKQVAVNGHALRQSVVNSALSPLGLIATAGLGFITTRRLSRKKQRPSPQPAATSPTVKRTSIWLNLLVPVAFAWLREIAITHLLRRNQEPPQQ